MINYQRILLQVLLIFIFLGIRYLTGRFFRGRKRKLWWRGLTTLLFFALALWNFGWYWSAYPVLIWMLWALLLILLQVVHNHEFIYRRYWPPFWQYSLYIALIAFAGSIFAGALPLV